MCPDSDYGQALRDAPGVAAAMREALRTYQRGRQHPGSRKSAVPPSCVQLFFIHVPKCGGMSLQAWLDETLGARSYSGNNQSLVEQLADTLNALEKGETRPTAAFELHTYLEAQTTKVVEPFPQIVERLFRVREQGEQLRARGEPACQVLVATALRNPPEQMRSAFYFDRGRRHRK
eukprot:3538493-Prymnesium_polylepis.1